jgi:hypothetical protein
MNYDPGYKIERNTLQIMAAPPGFVAVYTQGEGDEGDREFEMPVLAWLVQEVIHEYPSYPDRGSSRECVDTQVVAAVLDEESGTLTSVSDMASATKTAFVRVRPAQGHHDPKTGMAVDW